MNTEDPDDTVARYLLGFVAGVLASVVGFGAVCGYAMARGLW